MSSIRTFKLKSCGTASQAGSTSTSGAIMEEMCQRLLAVPFPYSVPQSLNPQLDAFMVRLFSEYQFVVLESLHVSFVDIGARIEAYDAL